jgi:hypothetical protein
MKNEDTNLDLTLVPAQNELNDVHLECVAAGKEPIPLPRVGGGPHTGAGGGVKFPAPAYIGPVMKMAGS